MIAPSADGPGLAARLARALPYLLLLAATAWLWTVANGIQFSGRPGALGPDFWPRAAIILIGAMSLLQIAKILLSGSEVEAGGATGQLEDGDDDDAPRQPLLLAGGIALTVAYAMALGVIGFPLATTAFLVAFMYLGGSRSHLAIWLSSVIGVAVVTVLLMRVVYVSLPRGAAPFDQLTDLITGF